MFRRYVREKKRERLWIKYPTYTSYREEYLMTCVIRSVGEFRDTWAGLAMLGS